MTALPVSGIPLTVNGPTSRDELTVLESPLPPALAVRELADRVVAGPDGAGLDWAGVPASELAAVALVVRQAWVGDLLATDGWCPDPGCRTRVDVSFRVGEYLGHVRPTVPAGVEATGDGWYRLTGEEVRFRVPSVADLVEALGGSDGVVALSASCVVPADLDDDQWSRVDRALESISPPLDGTVGGACPQCGASLELRFDPCSYVMAELRDLFAGLYYEVHLLASAYRWSEADILDLQRSRRIAYAHLVSEERALR
jgi:hypothetical protein